MGGGPGGAAAPQGFPRAPWKAAPHLAGESWLGPGGCSAPMGAGDRCWVTSQWPLWEGGQWGGDTSSRLLNLREGSRLWLPSCPRCKRRGTGRKVINIARCHPKPSWCSPAVNPCAAPAATPGPGASRGPDPAHRHPVPCPETPGSQNPGSAPGPLPPPPPPPLRITAVCVRQLCPPAVPGPRRCRGAGGVRFSPHPPPPDPSPDSCSSRFASAGSRSSLKSRGSLRSARGAAAPVWPA